MKELIGWVTLAVTAALALVLIWPARRTRGRPGGAQVEPASLAQAPRTPDPYVWPVRTPNPHDARWRRWSRRSRAHGLTGQPPLSPLREERQVWGGGEATGWQPPHPLQRAAERAGPFTDHGALVRPYVDHLEERQHR